MAPLPDFPLRESRRERDTETDQNAGTFRGTECSNPPPSSKESANFRSPDARGWAALRTSTAEPAVIAAESSGASKLRFFIL